MILTEALLRIVFVLLFQILNTITQVHSAINFDSTEWTSNGIILAQSFPLRSSENITKNFLFRFVTQKMILFLIENGGGFANEILLFLRMRSFPPCYRVILADNRRKQKYNRVQLRLQHTVTFGLAVKLMICQVADSGRFSCVDEGFFRAVIDRLDKEITGDRLDNPFHCGLTVINQRQQDCYGVFR